MFNCLLFNLELLVASADTRGVFTDNGALLSYFVPKWKMAGFCQSGVTKWHFSAEKKIILQKGFGLWKKKTIFAIA